MPLSGSLRDQVHGTLRLAQRDLSLQPTDQQQAAVPAVVALRIEDQRNPQLRLYWD